MSTPTKTRRMTAAQRREQLLDVTKAIVGEDGFHGVSIEAVARRAGITRPIVYQHFNDLRGLLEAMLEREGTRALTQLAAILPAANPVDPIDALVSATQGYLEAIRDDPVTWRLVLMPPEGAPVALRERIEAGRDAAIGVLANVVGEGGLGPGRASPDPPLTARILSAVAEEYARRLLTEPEDYPVERLAAHARWTLEQIATRRR